MNHELLFFFQSVLWGAALLFFYDILRIGRRLFPRRAFFVSLEDLLYWSFAGVFLFGKMYQANEGRLRAYAVIAVLLGMVIYAGTLSSKIVSVSVKILRVPLKFLVSLEKRLLFAARHCKIFISNKITNKIASRLRAAGRRLKGRVHTRQRGGAVGEKSEDKT